MKFSKIIKFLVKNGLVMGRSLPYDPEIKEIIQDSRESNESSLFVCIKGSLFDSHCIASKTKAAAFVCQSPIKTKKPFVIVKDSRLALSLISYEFYNRVYEKLKTFSVTGTKGKTTAIFFFKKIIESAGEKCALTSTVLNSTPNFEEPSEHTTQSSLYTAKLLKRALNEGVKFASIEASSQGLDMKRLDGFRFDRVAFLNLTRDHFDTHMNFENYFLAKVHLLDLVKDDGVVFVNLNAGKWANRYVREAQKRGLKTLTFGENGNILLKIKAESDEGIEFTLKVGDEEHSFFSSVIGKFMAENMTSSILAASSLGIDWNSIEKAVQEFNGVDGRMERYHGDEYDFYVDFAHTPGALEAALKAIKKLTQKRLILVFGAGGEADRGKRSLMGKMAQNYANLIFLTNDNPKSENPMVIIDEVVSGISQRDKLHVIPNRKRAIEEALRKWEPGDRVVIAGKGHEKTQIFNGYELPFNDKDVAFEILKEMGKI